MLIVSVSSLWRIFERSWCRQKCDWSWNVQVYITQMRAWIRSNLTNLKEMVGRNNVSWSVNIFLMRFTHAQAHICFPSEYSISFFSHLSSSHYFALQWPMFDVGDGLSGADSEHCIWVAFQHVLQAINKLNAKSSYCTRRALSGDVSESMYKISIFYCNQMRNNLRSFSSGFRFDFFFGQRDNQTHYMFSYQLRIALVWPATCNLCLRGHLQCDVRHYLRPNMCQNGILFFCPNDRFECERAVWELYATNATYRVADNNDYNEYYPRVACSTSTQRKWIIFGTIIRWLRTFGSPLFHEYLIIFHFLIYIVNRCCFQFIPNKVAKSFSLGHKRRSYPPHWTISRIQTEVERQRTREMYFFYYWIFPTQRFFSALLCSEMKKPANGTCHQHTSMGGTIMFMFMMCVCVCLSFFFLLIISFALKLVFYRFEWSFEWH